MKGFTTLAVKKKTHARLKVSAAIDHLAMLEATERAVNGYVDMRMRKAKR